MTEGIFTALLKAQQHADAITKSGTNTHQGWTFVTVEQVTRVAREALNNAGLVAYMRINGPLNERELDAYLIVVHPESGQELRLAVPWPVERAGPQARRAAYAYARKQALLELLCLSEADPEATAQPPAESKPGKRIRATPPRLPKEESAGATVLGVEPVTDTSGDIDAPMDPAEQVESSKPPNAPVRRDTPAPGMLTRPMAMAIHTRVTELERARGKLTPQQRKQLIAEAAGRTEPFSSTYDLTLEEGRRAMENLARMDAGE